MVLAPPAGYLTVARRARFAVALLRRSDFDLECGGRRRFGIFLLEPCGSMWQSSLACPEGNISKRRRPPHSKFKTTQLQNVQALVSRLRVWLVILKRTQDGLPVPGKLVVTLARAGPRAQDVPRRHTQLAEGAVEQGLIAAVD